jgi:hypothetical protein
MTKNPTNSKQAPSRRDRVRFISLDGTRAFAVWSRINRSEMPWRYDWKLEEYFRRVKKMPYQYMSSL